MKTILYELKDGLARITLNRPDKYNAFVKDMALALQQKLDECEENGEVRAIYLTGNGKAFCAGQDLKEAIDDNGIELEEIVGLHFNPVIEKIHAMPKPVICGVNGVAAGAGANIALACDIVVAKESATFIQAFSKIGLIPDSGGTWTLPRLIGRQKASALMMLGEPVGANEAERMGMIYKVFAEDEFEAKAVELAGKVAAMPTRGLALTKQALNESAGHSLQEQLGIEKELQKMAAETHDYTEGVNAFLEKRKPEFKGK